MHATDTVEGAIQRLRLDHLIAGANVSGFTIDYLEALTQGLSTKARCRVIDNLAALPSEMKEIDNPHVRRVAGDALRVKGARCKVTCAAPRSGVCRLYFHKGSVLFAVLEMDAALLPDEWPDEK